MPVTSYSTTAGNNNGAPPNGAPEGMAPSDVNNCLRQIMADLAVEAQTGAVSTLNTIAGTDTITADMNPELAAYATGMMIKFTPANNNTGAATINIDGLGAKAIVKGDNTALIAGDLQASTISVAVYDGTSFVLLNPQTAAMTAAAILAALLTVDGAGSGLDADTLDGISSAAFVQTSSDSFTAEITDVNGTVTGTIFYKKTGHMVSLWVDGSGVMGTSDGTGFTFTGLPAAIRPTTAVLVPTYVRDNGVYFQSFASFSNSTTVTFFDSSGVGAGFTAAGEKGLYPTWSISYPLS